MRARSQLAAVAAAALLTTSCQVRLGTDIGVSSEGSGDIEVTVLVDAELTRLLEGTGIDLFRGLESVREGGGPWQIDGGATDDGGVAVRLRATFDDPEGLALLVDDLHAPLDDGDVRLFDRLDVETLEGGAARFEGAVGLRLPAAPGARGRGVDFDRDDLERLLRDRPQSVVYDVRVTLPAPPLEHDADEVDGRTLVWRAPVGAVREVGATSERPSGLPLSVYVAGVVGALIVAAAARAALRRSA